MNRSRSPFRSQGFTLVEMLLSAAILGVLMLTFTQIFGRSLRASGEIGARNELISEGQIAQQLVSSKLQSAYYVYPPGTTLQLTTNHATTLNTVRAGAAGQNWTVGTDPFAAVLVPPRSSGTCNAAGDRSACYTFYAYYPVLRGSLTANAPSVAPDADPNNANAWVLMEFRSSIVDNVTRGSTGSGCTSPSAPLETGLLYCPPLPGTTYGTAYRSSEGRLLIDYVQPAAAPGLPAYTLFRVCNPATSTAQPACPAGTTGTSPRSVEFDLRLLQNRVGRALTAPAGNAVLSTRVYPRN